MTDKYKTWGSLALLAIIGLSIYIVARPGPKSLFANPIESVTEKVSSTDLPSPNLAKTIADPNDPPAGYIEYKNDRYGFSYWHSPEAKITEYDEGGGAATIVHENLVKLRGLQVFVVPYSGDIITDARFHKDVPSGVRYNIENTTIGEKKIPAVTFNSHDDTLGDTREVWFIYNGYLYEITTFKGFGDWLGPILQTWRFI